LLKCRTSTACSRSAAANTDPPRIGCLTKTKFALEGRTIKPSLISSRAYSATIWVRSERQSEMRIWRRGIDIIVVV
jgi:hypothetical protein